MQSRESELFKRIYHAAIRGDQAELAKIIQQHKSLDVGGKIGLFTPAARLATQGNHKAVALLQSFGASPDYIAMGYVYANNLELAEKMRREMGVKIHFLALGAGLARNHDYAKHLQKQYHLHPEYIVLGAMIRDDDAFAESLIHDDLEDDAYLRARLAQLNAILVGDPATIDARAKLVCRHSREKLEDDVAILDGFVKSNPDHIFQYQQTLKKIGACGAGMKVHSLREWRGLNDTSLLTVNRETIVSAMDASGYIHSEALLTYELVFTKNPEFINQLSEATQSLVNKFGLEIPGIQEAFLHQCFKQFNRSAARATKMIAIMQALQFDYDQAYAFVTNPQIRDCLHLALTAQDMPAANSVIAMLMSSHGLMSLTVSRDMIKKYLEWSARYILDASLSRLHNANYSSWNPIYWPNNNLDRAESLRVACKGASSAQIHGWIMLQFGLFNGTIKLAPDLTKPKHEQPLSKPNPDSIFFKVIKEMVESPRFKILSGN